MSEQKDRPAREKIADLGRAFGIRESWLEKFIKGTLALFPDIDKIRKDAYRQGVFADKKFRDMDIEEAKREERERIKKSINTYYARPDVEQGIIGFTEAVRQAQKGD